MIVGLALANCNGIFIILISSVLFSTIIQYVVKCLFLKSCSITTSFDNTPQQGQMLKWSNLSTFNLFIILSVALYIK